MKNIGKNFFSGLRGQVRIVFSVIFLVSLVAQGGYIHQSTQKGYMDYNYQRLENVADLLYQMTDIYIESSIKNNLAGIASQAYDMAAYYYNLAEKGTISQQEAYDSFRRIMEDPAYYKVREEGYICALKSNGYLDIHPFNQGQNISIDPNLPEIESLKNLDRGFISYEYLNSDGPETVRKVASFRYFVPWDLFLLVSANESDFDNIVSVPDLKKEFEKVKISEQGYPFLMDMDGKLLIHPEREGQVILNNTDIGRNKIVKDQVIENSAGQGTFSFPGEDPNETNPRLKMGAFRHYTRFNQNWVIVAVSTKAELDDSVSGILNWSLIIIIIAYVLIVVLVGAVISIILKPIAKMKEIATMASEGDLSRRISITSQDEIGEMSSQFNILVSNFENVLNRLKNSSSMLLDSVQGLTVSAQEIASTSNEQAAAVKEIVSTMEDSDTLAKSIAEKINDVAHIAGKMKETVSDGFSIIKESLYKMDEIKKSNSETIIGVQSLSDKIGSIWEIVNIINGIADQTKIIAFNAELEASAAGEAGKNFQIVATEIRRLADNTVSSTNEIKAKINEIQHSSDNLIISSEEGTAKIKDGWQLSNQLQQVFEDILHSSEISATSADQIALSINQQVAAFEQILLTLKQISEGIDNFVLSTKSTTRESEKLSDMADSLNETVIAYITTDGEDYGE